MGRWECHLTVAYRPKTFEISFSTKRQPRCPLFVGSSISSSLYYYVVHADRIILYTQHNIIILKISKVDSDFIPCPKHRETTMVSQPRTTKKSKDPDMAFFDAVTDLVWGSFLGDDNDNKKEIKQTTSTKNNLPKLSETTTSAPSVTSKKSSVSRDDAKRDTPTRSPSTRRQMGRSSQSSLKSVETLRTTPTAADKYSNYFGPWDALKSFSSNNLSFAAYEHPSLEAISVGEEEASLDEERQLNEAALSRYETPRDSHWTPQVDEDTVPFEALKQKFEDLSRRKMNPNRPHVSTTADKDIVITEQTGNVTVAPVNDGQISSKNSSNDARRKSVVIATIRSTKKRRSRRQITTTKKVVRFPLFRSKEQSSSTRRKSRSKSSGQPEGILKKNEHPTTPKQQPATLLKLNLFGAKKKASQKMPKQDRAVSLFNSPRPGAVPQKMRKGFFGRRKGRTTEMHLVDEAREEGSTYRHTRQPSYAEEDSTSYPPMVCRTDATNQSRRRSTS